jgi:hypothetical protein
LIWDSATRPSKVQTGENNTIVPNEYWRKELFPTDLLNWRLLGEIEYINMVGLRTYQHSCMSSKYWINNKLEYLVTWKIYTHCLCNENQLDALFILCLFRQSTSTCFGYICSPSSGGILYIHNNWYVMCFLVDSQLAGQQTIKWGWIVHQVGFYYVDISRCTVNKTQKIHIYTLKIYFFLLICDYINYAAP